MLLEPAAASIQKSDWAKLASSLGTKSYIKTEVWELFYPNRDNDSTEDVLLHSSTALNGKMTWQKGFFSSLD